MIKDCPYCNLKPGQEKFIVEGSNVALYARNYNGDIVLTVYGEDFCNYSPYYCPNCGKQLQKSDC